MNARRMLGIGAAMIVAAGVVAWWLLAHSHSPPTGAERTSAGRTVLYWYDPMRPEQHFDAPGKSPFMDMALLPRYADEAASASSSVAVDPRMAQNLGIRTTVVRRGAFAPRIEASGRIDVDEQSIRTVAIRTSGSVASANARAVGDAVAAGEVLARVSSAAFDAAEREFLLALDAGDATLIDAARARLKLIDVGDAQIARIARARTAERDLDVVAPIAGYVMRIDVRVGAAFDANAPLFELASHDPMWLLAELPEAESTWVRVGQVAEVRVAAYPGEAFAGSIDYLYPMLEDSTRTRRMRLVLPNHPDRLHPGMYATAIVSGETIADALLVPSDAVVRTGRRNVVIVADDAGRYRPVEVRLGPERSGETVVLDGVAAGDRVVTSGQFLLDSEASIRGLYNRADADTSDGPAPRSGEEHRP